jgi:hypothetical protein
MLRKTIAVGPLEPLEGTWLDDVAVAKPDLRCQLYVIEAGSLCRTVAQVLVCRKCPVLQRGVLSAIV